MGAKHLTADQKRQIVETYRELLSTRATAERLRLGYQRVCLVLKRAGIDLTGGTGGCYQNVQQVREWAAAGLSFSEIGRRLGSKHQTVAKFLRQHGIPHTPHENKLERNGRWKGGRLTDKAGYILVKRPDHPHADRHGYVREHRLVMEQTLGRLLEPSEVVHHKDDNPANNHPDNLEVFQSNGEHLGATLTGKRPDWTPDGWDRMRAKRRPRTARQQTSNPTR